MAGETGWRSHSSTKASIPSRSSRSARAHVSGRAAGDPVGLGLEPGRRTLEDEAAHDPRVRDR